MEFRILGPLEVWEADRPLSLGGAKQRALLAILLLHANRVVPTDRLIELLWGEEPSETVGNTLQVYVSQLRKILEKDHVRGTPYQVLVSQPPGYLLRVAPDQFDLRRFEQLQGDARQASQSGYPETAAAGLREALDLWRGQALADLATEPFALAEATRLNEMRMQAMEERVEADLALGRHGDLVGELEAAVAVHPLRERLRGQLMLALYRSGRQAEASDLFHKTRAALVEELGMEPGPDLQQLFKAILNQDSSLSLAPEIQTRPQPKTDNLPVELTSFVGRVEEIAEIRRLLSQNRLVTVTGAGGMGKTRLAIQVAAQVRDAYRHGAWLVELAPVSEPTLVPQSVASTLGVREQPGRPLTEALINYLQTRQLLLVVDNCEHVVEASAGLFEALLRACPDLSILATSREVLRIRGEAAWRVPSMSIPDPDPSRPETNLVPYEAIALFVDRAAVAIGSFELSDENSQLVAEICRRLDGIPLAIELAVGRLRALSLEQVADRLHERFRFLTGGSRTAMPRQQTLSGTIDWSYDLLSNAQRALFRRLSFFAGGFSVEAAEAVGACTSVKSDEVLDVLTDLVARSLVIVDRDGTNARYRLLETLRQYGWEKLTESGEDHTVRDQHSLWFLQLSELAEADFRGPRQTAAFDRLESEHDNLRASLGWSLETGDTDSCLRLAGAMGYFWRKRGHLTEGRNWLERTLEASAGSRSGPGKALLWASALANDCGDFTRAEVLGKRCVAKFDEARDHWGLGFAQHILSSVAFSQDKLDQAAELLDESLSEFRKSEDTWGIALGLHSLGFLFQARGEFDRAFTVLGEALALFRDVGDQERVAASLQQLGTLQLAQGNFAVAGRLLEECLVSIRGIGAKELLAGTYYHLGVLRRCLGDLERAKTLQEASLRGFRDLNDRQSAAYALAELGTIAALQGDVSRARALLQEGLGAFRDLRDRYGIAKAAEALAVAEIHQQAYRAATLLGAAEAIRQSTGEPLAPYERPEHETLVASARADLGESQYARAHAEGRSLALEETVSFGLEGQDLAGAEGDAPLAISSADWKAPD